MNLKKNKLALFDMDGTLFDTTLVNFHSYKTALNKFGYELDFDFYWKEFHGHSYSYFLPLVVGDNQEILKEVHAYKKEIYPDQLIYARKNEFIFDIILALKSTYHIGLVTSASRQNTNDLLNHFKITDLFEIIITREDVENAKPSPEGFLRAMKFFEIDAANTIIYEDSEVGIEAAKNSGANVLKVFEF